MSRRSENSIIGMRIQLLASKQKDHSINDCSPTLKDLREKNPNRVRKFLDVYESKPWCMKTGINWWLDEILPSDSTPRVKFSASHIIPVRAPPLHNAKNMKEILLMEQEHIAHLNRSIGIINAIVKNSRGFIAMKLRENQFCMFGDLKNVYGLHKIVILPKITAMAPNGKCIDFIRFLVQLVDLGHFYCYVRHKMMERSMRKLLIEHVFITELGDLEPAKPFRILDVYYNWIENICNELMKQPTENADDIAVCIEAEKKLMDLMEVITEAQSVSRITQIQEIPFEIQVKVFGIVKTHEEIKPMLLLIPKKNLKFSYRYPVSFKSLIITKHFFD